MSAADVIEVAAPDDANTGLFSPSGALIESVDLVEHHVTAVTTAPFDQSLGRGAGLIWRHDLDELIADHHQRVDETEFAHTWVVETHREAEGVAEFRDDGIEVPGDERNLSESNHALSVLMRPSRFGPGPSGRITVHDRVEEGDDDTCDDGGTAVPRGAGGDG